jgi:hypothetical protein
MDLAAALLAQLDIPGPRFLLEASLTVREQTQIAVCGGELVILCGPLDV